jgi:hypothetical protein
MLLNAEGLPIESIDKIELTLNPQLASFINWENRNKIDSYLNIRYSNYYGFHYYLDIQAQYIYKYPEIKLCIVYAISELMDKGFITFKLPIPYISTYFDYFVYELREIEFAFDFEPEAVHIKYPDKLIHCKNTVYTMRRKNIGKTSRKSIIKSYDHNASLNAFHQTPQKDINDNRYSQRIEFCLSKYNCPYRNINNIIGNPYDVIKRYAPYLAILYHRHLYGNMTVNTNEHPYFNLIYNQAGNDRLRYTGSLGKTVTHKSTKDEDAFFKTMFISKMTNQNIPSDILAILALGN